MSEVISRKRKLLRRVKKEGQVEGDKQLKASTENSSFSKGQEPVHVLPDEDP